MTIAKAPDARPDAPPRFRSPVRQDPDLRAVRNEFDIEIERIAMAQNGQVTHEADLDMHRDTALRNGAVTDVPQSQHTSLAPEHPNQCPLVEAVSDSDPASIPAESDSIPPADPTDRLELHPDSIPSLGTCDEAEKDPSPPEARFMYALATPSPSPDLLGSQHPQAGPETIMRDGSARDDTKAAPESCGDQAGNWRDVATTIQSVQINRPLVRDAGLDIDERGRLAKENQVSVFSRLRQQTRLLKQPKVTLASTRSLRRRPNVVSTRPERSPVVSVAIPTRRTDELVASTKTNSPTRARRYKHRGDSDSVNLNNDRGQPRP